MKKAIHPLISIILPIHNGQDYLDECVGSVVAQTYKNLEIILVNDGSDDGSDVIAKSWLKKDNRIVYVETNKLNAALARKEGIEISKGEYICFTDSDDIIHEDYVVSMYDAAANTGADIVTSKIVPFANEDDISKISAGSGETSAVSDLAKYFFEHYHWDTRGDYIAQSINAKLFKRFVLSKIDYSVIQTSILEDNFIMPQVYKAVSKDEITLVDRIYYYYRQNPNSTMSGSLSKKFMYDGEEIGYPQLFEKAMDYVQKLFPDRPDIKPMIQEVKIERYFTLAKHVVECNIQNKQLLKNVEMAEERINSMNRELNETLRSKPYRLGVFILKPLHFIKHRVLKGRY